jgi:hypothetical protein
MVYLGVDLHRKRSVVTALAEDGTVMLSRRIASAAEPFRRVFGELEPWSLSVVFEATYGWHWFADLLADAGIEAHMAHPLATKAISAGRVKNDSVDARTLAHLLRTHLLPEAWIAPTEVRERRRLVRTRTSLVRIRSRLRCQVHAILADHCVQPPLESVFGPAGRRFLKSVELPAVDRGRVDAALRLTDAVTAEVIGLDKELRGLAPIPWTPKHLRAKCPERGGPRAPEPTPVSSRIPCQCRSSHAFVRQVEARARQRSRLLGQLAARVGQTD